MNITQRSFIALLFILIALAVFIAQSGGGSGTVTGVTGAAPITSSGGTAPDIALALLTAGADADSTTAQSDSGLEVVSSGLVVLRGCSDDFILKWDETEDDWNCEADATGAGGSAIVLDLADDDVNESVDLNEIAITGDTNSIFTESAADKLLIAVALNWPTSDTADALSANPADCAANQFAETIAANGDLTCLTIVDADVPDTITIDLAATATALAANPTDCAANTFADAIAASGDLTCNPVASVDITDDSIAEVDLDFVDVAADEECLTFESGAGGDFEWQACGAADQNLFETINAPAGTNPVADSTTDTLNLTVTGTDLTITGTAGTDTIDFDVVTNAGTDITADLEEEDHSAEHITGGNDILYTERHAVWIQADDVSTAMAIEDIRIYADNSGTIQDVRCSVNTTPTTDAVTIDVNLNGTTIFTTQGNRPSIAAATNTDVSGAPDVTAYVSGDFFDIDVDVADSGNTAADLTCQMRTREAVFDTT